MTVCDKHCLVIMRFWDTLFSLLCKKRDNSRKCQISECANAIEVKLDPLVRSLSDLRERIKGSDFNKLAQMRK